MKQQQPIRIQVMTTDWDGSRILVWNEVDSPEAARRLTGMFVSDGREAQQ